MNRWSEELMQLTSEIGLFLEDCAERSGSWDHDEESFFSVPEMGYADALLKWRADGKNPNSFFSTNSALLLQFKDQLEEKYGLPILTTEAGARREAELRLKMQVFRKNTTSFLN